MTIAPAEQSAAHFGMLLIKTTIFENCVGRMPDDDESKKMYIWIRDDKIEEALGYVREKNEIIKKKDKELEEKDKELEEKDKELEEKDKEHKLELEKKDKEHAKVIEDMKEEYEKALKKKDKEEQLKSQK